MIDGVTVNIETHFANVYDKLYNSIDDNENLTTVLRHLNTKIDSKSMIEVKKITPALIKEAINKLLTTCNIYEGRSTFLARWLTTYLTLIT